MKDNYLSQENLEKKLLKIWNSRIRMKYSTNIISKLKISTYAAIQLNLEKHSIVDVKGSLRYRRQLMILIQ